jgi:radical SAM family uncharacterized protein
MGTMTVIVSATSMDRKTLLGSESGGIRKDWRGKTSVALVYPNNYYLGMSNLGFQTVYALLNRFDDVVAERVFFPGALDTPAGSSYNRLIRSMESQRPLSDFDIVAFSIPFENDYPHILAILESAGIPKWSRERQEDSPLIIGGGVAFSLNPEPIAPFFDCIVIGEVEPVLSPFFEVYRRAADKTDFLEHVAREVVGVYVPILYDVAYGDNGTIAAFSPKKEGIPTKIQRSVVADLSFWDTCTTILTPHTEFASTFLVEIGRGCTHGCRFCAASYVYRPPRLRPSESLKQSLAMGADRASRIGLVGAAVSDLPQIEAVCNESLGQGVRISFSSLRADSINKEVIDILEKSGAKTVALAPDAGSARMRCVINKGITQENILSATELLVSHGIQNLKLYFMVGLPTETRADVKEIVDLCKRVKHRFLRISRGKKRIGNITVSLNCFVPKPHTPFQWTPFEEIRSLKEKIKFVKDGLKRVANVRVHADIPKWAYIQALLSRGDRRIAKLLEVVQQNNGNWAQSLKSYPFNPDFYVRRERPFDEVLPWDFINHGIKKSFLIKEYEMALQAKPSPNCQPGQCKICGVC